jgi:hypothetical protein
MMQTERKRAVAAYWQRWRRKPTRRGLVNRLRRVMFPRARKAGPTYPSIRPSRADLPKFVN